MADGGGSKTKEINASLKAAKEAIKRKEYKEAAKYCRNVLKLDKANYHAYVFVGLCAKELEQFKQSRAAYKKAIECDPEQILAWQGLYNLYEATPPSSWENEMSHVEWEQECVSVYTKLLPASKNDLSKWKDLLSKLIPLQLSLGMASKALQNLKDLEGVTPEPSEDLLNLWKKCLQVFQLESKKSELTLELQSQMENVFQSVLEYSRILGFSTEEPQSEYLHFLSSSTREDMEESQITFFENQILEKGRNLLEQYPTNIFALQLVIKFLMEESFDLSMEVLAYIEKLNAIDPTNSLSIIGSAYSKGLNRSWTDTVADLKRVEAKMSAEYIPFYWFLFSKAYYHLHKHSLSLIYTEKGKKFHFVDDMKRYLGKTLFAGLRGLRQCLTDGSRRIYGLAFTIQKAACFVEKKNYDNAKILLSKLIEEEPDNVEALNLLGNLYALQEKNENALEICSKLSEINPNSHGCLFIKALISVNEAKFYDAEIRLQEAIELKSDIPRYHFLLGKVYWNLRTSDISYAKKAHASFCEAAKLDLYDSAIFLALGEYYRDVAGNLQKAKKCFQKAVSLDEFNEEACLALGDISMELDDEDATVDIYEKTTRNFGPGRAKVAWLRLGMLLTKRGDPDKALSCFQGAIRCDPSDRRLWECLGDAFIARGSYNSAMKAFQKALEIDPSSIYCRYKIGVIKQAIFLFAEAISDFEKVVALKEDFIPAMKGISDCHLRLEYSSIAENFDGRAVEHAERVLSVSSKVIEIRPDLHCIWKTVGDACFALGVIEEEKLRLEIPSLLSKTAGLQISEGQTKKSVLLDLSRRCFAVIVKLEETSAHAWHDFALSSFHYGMSLNDETGKSIIQQSLQFIKKAINLEPQNFRMWNTLGVISASSDLANPELSQHAFIKALQLEPKSAEVWANLGGLYLKYNKIREAHEAFKKAQDADPIYPPAWVGQASIAEIMGDEDAMDLFRHSSELGSNAESFLAYAKWVCFEVKNFYNKMEKSLWKVDSLHLPLVVRKAIANSCVCAHKFTERNSTNSCAFNLFGNLLEHQMLYKHAERSFSKALAMCLSTEDSEKRNLILSNLARVQRQSGQYKNAIETYLEIKPLIKPDDVTGLALSYYFDGQLEESLQSYEKSLSLAEDERDKSDILVAMGMVAYTAGNPDLAKSHLRKSSQTTLPSGHGLMALASIGLLMGHHTLVNAALDEIKKHPDYQTELMEGNCAYLDSALSLIQGNVIEAKRKIQVALIRYPKSATLWNKLATFIFQRAPVLSLEVAGRCAQIASIHHPSELSLMITSAASIGSKSFASTSSDIAHYSTSLHTAEKAVHANPKCPENWALLATAALAKSVFIEDVDSSFTAISTARLALLKAEENLSRLQEALKTTVSKRLVAKIKVAVNLRVHAIETLIWAYLHGGNYELAFLLSDNAASQYEGDESVSKELLFLKIVTEMLWNSKRGELSNDLLSSAMAICDAGNDSIRNYKILSNVCFQLGLPLVSELAIRKCIKLAAQNGLAKTHYTCLIQLSLLSIKCFSKDRKDKWFDLAKEALTEATRLSPDDHLINVLRVALLNAKESPSDP